MLLVDTNVLVDVFERDADWYPWSVGQLRAQSQVEALAINPIVYAELSLTFHSPGDLDKQLETMDVRMLELPRPALFLAGKAFVRYRREGGPRQNVLADFFIGAHAAVLGCALLTRDARRYRSYFPTVQLITPD